MRRILVTLICALAAMALLVATPAVIGAAQKKGTQKSTTTKKKRTTTQRSSTTKKTTSPPTKKAPGDSSKPAQQPPKEDRDQATPAAPQQKKQEDEAASRDEKSQRPEEPVLPSSVPLKRLFNGKDLSGWRLRTPDGKNAWKVEDGVLKNTEPGTDLVSEEKFEDFELHIEVNVPPGGNSGVYLQGRYEVQIHDSAGMQQLTNSMMGAIYSKVAPRINAAKPAGEWQTLDIHFQQAVRDKDGKVVMKPLVTIILNDEIICDRAEIDGVTGGALDNEEGTPGPIMLQGDHTAVQYRNILIRPLPGRKWVEEEEEAAPPPPAAGSDGE